MSDRYEFPGLPLNPVRPGRTLLVQGDTVGGAVEFVLRGTDPVDGREDEGAILVSTNTTGDALLADRRDYGCGAAESVRVVDCVSLQQGTEPGSERVEGVSTPADLTGIGMRVSAFYQQLQSAGRDRIRLGVLSASTLLMYSELRRVSRFVHVLTGRVAATDGVAFVSVDPAAHEERVVSTLQQLCDGRVEFRTEGDERQVRIGGLPGQPDGWTPF
ncbi:MAG: hypothetical protein ABEH47_07555 [Haloferacaceae archaeon]